MNNGTESSPMVEKQEPILKGVAASSGRASGPVRVLAEDAESDDFPTGSVLVSPVTTPKLLPYILEASAIVTDTGGLTSHAAIVSRELGIPCVVDTESATSTLVDGMNVEVDGDNGLVFLVESK